DQPELPEPGEDPGFDPLLKAAVGRAAGADAGRVQGVPLAAGAEHEEDSGHGLAVLDARIMAAGRGDPPRGHEVEDPDPERVGDAPAVVDDPGGGLGLSLGHGETPGEARKEHQGIVYKKSLLR